MSAFASKAHVLNVTLTDANTDYEVVLPAGATRFAVQCRTADEIKIFFHKGSVNFWTVKVAPARPFMARNVTGGARTFWLQSAAGAKVAEVIYWT
jgi:hypothetical protein